MSWRKAGELARAEAKAAREEANAVVDVDDERAGAFRRYLQLFPDQPALAAWTRRRKSQHLEEFAEKCDARKTEDITVADGGRKR